MPPAAATAIAAADRPYPELASDVVREALGRAGASLAHGVLLFLSADFARHAQAAVSAAARAANCLQVAGCTATGVFNELDWVLDRPAASAMVFSGGSHLAQPGSTSEPVISLGTPHVVNAGWLNARARRLGMLSTDSAGIGAGRAWTQGKVAEDGRSETTVRGARAAIGISRGIRHLCEPMTVQSAGGYDLERVGGRSALQSLVRQLPFAVRELQTLPVHLVFLAVVGEDGGGRSGFELVPVVAVNAERESVTLGSPVPAGAAVFWTMRQAVAAESDTRTAIAQARAELAAPAEFAIAFSCMGRGPYFFDGVDRDLGLLKEHFPGMPIVGAYGAGEIVPLPHGNAIVHNSTAFALYSSHVQS